MLIFGLKSDKMQKSFFLLLGFIYFSMNALSTEVHYQLEMPNPNSHYFEVTMDISDLKSNETILKMPVWAPGSYLVREFAKSVNLVKVFDNKGVKIPIEKINKNSWLINTKGHSTIKVKYEVYAFELSVRTSFLDDSHGYINGTSMFMYIKDKKDINGKLTIKPHPSFKKIATALPLESGTTYTFKDYDHLVDCPIEIGNHQEFSFDAAGVHHKVAMYGEGNYDIEKLKTDMAKIVESETKIFGENPNKEYLFIIHNLTNPSGGLEHKNSTTLQVSRWTYEGNSYFGFISLVAHEYFHLWNVKRLRPKELGPFNYDEENYTDLLWVMEGFTSYYDELALRRAGLYTQDQYLGKLFGTINYVENQPGNLVQPVAHASFDAWIKAYRSNENSVNTTISYYSKGQILAAMLDIYIITKFKGKKSLDNFMQALYQEFYKKKDIGFTEEEFHAALEDFLGEDMDWFFDNYIYGTQVIDYEKFFKGIGLAVTGQKTIPNSKLGIRTKTENGKIKITTVYSGSVAEEQGLSVNDEIIGFNGYRLTEAVTMDHIDELSVGEKIDLLIARDGILLSYTITIKESFNMRYDYNRNFDGNQEKLFDYWLRVDEF